MKYYFVSDPGVSRQLWYWYYLPMLFIPLIAVFVSMSLGKPENYRLPKWTILLYIPTIPIEGGHILWLEDISEIAALLNELEEN